MSETALLVIDVQESFRHRDYWSDQDYPSFADRLQILMHGAREEGIPLLQVFHVDPDGPFSLASGHVRTLSDLVVDPVETFWKRSHSALVGSGLDVWLTQRGIRRLIVSGIRTEQCCETTTRHASDLGYTVDFVMEATLTFTMTGSSGRVWAPSDIEERTELVLQDRFASVVNVEDALRRGRHHAT